MGSHALIYGLVALAIAAVCLFAGLLWGRSNVKAQIEEAVEKEHVALDAREFAMRTQLEDALAEVAKLRPLAEELGRVQKRLEREQAKYAQMRAEFNAAMGSSEAIAGENPEPQPAQVQESADEAIQKLLQSLEVFNDPNGAVAAEPAQEKIDKPAISSPPVPAAPAPPPARIPEPARPTTAPRVAQTAQPAAAARRVEAPRPPTPQAVPPVPSMAPAAAAQPRPAVPPPSRPAAPAPRQPIANVPSKPTPAPIPAGVKPGSGASVKPGQQVDEWQEFARQLEALTGKKK